MSAPAYTDRMVASRMRGVVLLWCALHLALSLASLAAAQASDAPDQPARTRPPAIEVYGRRNLSRIISNSGLSGRSTPVELGALLDADEDLAVEPSSERLVYECRGAVPRRRRSRPVSPQLSADGAAAAAAAAAEGAAPGEAWGAPRRLQQRTTPIPPYRSSGQDEVAEEEGEDDDEQGWADGDARQAWEDHHEHHDHHHHHNHTRIMLEDTEFAEIGQGAWLPSVPDTPIASQEAFRLHSRPSAAKKIFLDFDGHTVVGTNWNTRYKMKSFYTAPYDKDGNISNWSAQELSDILAVWRGVTEDYAAFEVDVTTEDPGEAYLAANGIRVVIGGSSMNLIRAPAGGVAFLNSFGKGSKVQPVFAFAKELKWHPKFIWEAVSHEVGHSLGLKHDGGGGDRGGYFWGFGDVWAPILGASYYARVTQFSKGEYKDSNNKEDDFALINRYLPYITQEQGSTLATATPMTAVNNPGGVRLPLPLLLGNPSDVDMRSFVAPVGGTATVRLLGMPDWGNAGRANLNCAVRVLNSAGVALATQSGVGVAPFAVSLPSAGTYYISVTPSGQGSAISGGYSSYGSRGQYLLSVTFPTAVTAEMPLAPIAPNPEDPALVPLPPPPFPDNQTYDGNTTDIEPLEPDTNTTLLESPSPEPAVSSPSPAPAGPMLTITTMTTSARVQPANTVRCTVRLAIANSATGAPLTYATAQGSWDSVLPVAGFPYSATSPRTSPDGVTSFTSLDIPYASGHGCRFVVTRVTLSGYTWDPASGRRAADPYLW